MRNASEFMPGDAALAGRTVLVVGAHGALGEAAALACASAGATVVLLGRRVPKLTRLYDRIAASGAAQPAIYPLDLEGASPDDYAQLVDTVTRECGSLDGVLVCAAEFKGLASIENSDAADLVRAVHVNLLAPLLLTRACLPALRQRPDASVVYLLDDISRIGRAFWGGYAIAKQGLAALVRVLHDETEHSSVRVHGLQPGPMRTALRARAFFSENPGEVPEAGRYAPVCVYLLSAAGADERGSILDVAA